jgi:hypothetical protein
MRRRSALTLTLALAALAATAPAPARAAACPPATVHGVRVVELTDERGCERGANLASRTVRAHGYLETATFFCRWGQGGTRPIERNGRTFYGPAPLRTTPGCLGRWLLDLD